MGEFRLARRGRALRAAVVLAVLSMLSGVGPLGATQSANAAVTDDVLILGSTVIGGSSSIEATEVASQGFNPVVVDAATWSSMTASDFASYRAIILGDPDSSAATLAAAEANVNTWAPVVNGNVLIIGTDPVGHSGQGGEELTRRGVDFVLSQPDKTGLYFVLSQNYDGAPSGTTVPILEGLRPDGFSITGQLNCYNNAHIVATHPALAGLTDSDLSGWGCSVHEAFDTWPGDFSVLAIAKDFNQTFTASDGTIGAPYILATGEGLKSFPLSLDPLNQSNELGGLASVTAELLDGTTLLPQPGAQLGFVVEAGPNAGVGGICSPATCVTDTSGKVNYFYAGNGTVGTDTIRVWLDSNSDGLPGGGEPQTTAAARWVRFDCRQLLLYFARGSSQWDNVDRSTPWFGSAERNSLFSEIRSRLPQTGRSWTIEEHDAGQVSYNGSRYDAVGGTRNEIAAWASGQGTAYYDSVDRGVDEVLNYLNDRAEECPDEQWIVGGYSQGAHMLGNVLSNSALSPAVIDNIRFVSFFGDPKLSLNGRGNRWTAPACKGAQFQWVRGNVACNADGGILGQRVPYVPSSLQARLGSWCDQDDGVCAGEEFFRGSLGSHGRYPSNWMPQAASEAVTNLSP